MKKIISALLAMIMLLFLLVGCDCNCYIYNICEFCETVECDNSCQDLDISLCEYCESAECDSSCQDLISFLCLFCYEMICICEPCEDCRQFPWNCVHINSNIIRYPRPPFDISVPTLQPPREGAVIIPRQGGAMLFPFPAAEPFIYLPSAYDGSPAPHFLQGLVSDLGEVIAEPQYDHVQYITGRFGHILGILAWRNEVVVHYDLYGNATPLPFTAQEITPSFDGRYWYVQGVGLQFLFHERFSFDAWGRELRQNGIWDMEAKEFVFPPTDGVHFFVREGLFLGSQWEGYMWNSPLIRSFYWNSFDNTTRDFPMSWVAQSFHLENSLFDVVVDSERRLADWNMNLISRNDAAVSNLIDFRSSRRIKNLVLVRSFDFQFGRSRLILFDVNNNVIHAERASERLFDIYCYQTDRQFVRLINHHTNEILKEWDAYTGEVTTTDIIDWWHEFDDIASAHFDVDLTLEENAERLWIVDTTEDGLIMVLQHAWQSFDGRLVAIDWDGNIITDHPLLPFYDQNNMRQRPRQIGHAVRNFFWTEHEGQRGIINSQGQWVFVAE